MTRQEYVETVLAMHKRSPDSGVYERYAELYEDYNEPVEDFIQRCAEQDYEDGAYGGAVYQFLKELKK